MNFNRYSYLKGTHALLSPSNYHVLNYTPDKVENLYHSQYRKTIGTEIHEIAANEIALRHKQGSGKHTKDIIEYHIYNKYFDKKHDELSKMGETLIGELGYLPKEVFETFKAYVNDAIGYRMEPEVAIAYTEDIYGTADAISFKNNMLRIHDLKTGSTPAHMEQLEFYAALFCLGFLPENVRPGDISFELRLYQNSEVIVAEPSVSDILPIMDKLVAFNKVLTNLKS